MKVLVTGSAGRIGARTVYLLLDAGFRVRGFDHLPANRDAPGYEETVASLCDSQAVEAAVNGCDVVLHLGALMSWVRKDQDRMFGTNVEGTRHLLHAAASARINRFVFASSGEVYPENRPVTQPIDEEHPLRANTPYGLTKILGEELVRFHQRRGDFETVILRFSHTQEASELLDETSMFSGPRFFLKQRIRQMELFGRLGPACTLRALDPGVPAHILVVDEDGLATKMHIADSRDIAEGILIALTRPEAAGGVFNLGATEPVEFRWLVPRMARITGYPVVTATLEGMGVRYHTSNKRIRKKLGFQPKWTIDRMLTEAETAWRKRKATQA